MNESDPSSTNSRRRRGEFFDTARDLPADYRVPFEIEIVHRDDDILIADKPHYLNTTPRGEHVKESLVTRLRSELDLPDLSPAHRLDRMTAGLLVCTLRRDLRGSYQTMFADRLVRKTYLAVANDLPGLDWPRTVESRIVKDTGTPIAREEPGPVNAVTEIDKVITGGGRAGYRLVPLTGRTHQLRIHLNSLGIPIVGDNFYPSILDTAMDDYSAPLQLLAKTVEFRDPLSGLNRSFTSRRRLAEWPS